MTEPGRKWLPLTVVEQGGLRDVAREVLDGWSRAWFADAAFGVARLKAKAGAAPAVEADAPWRFGGHAVALSCSRRAALRLQELALGIRLGDVTRSGPDQAVLAAFERKLLDDLCLRLEAVLGVAADHPSPGADADPFDGVGGAIVEVSDAGGAAFFKLAVPFDVALGACQPAGAAASGLRPRLASLVEALGPTPVTLDAFLGSAEVAFAELRTLAPGDVLMLDTALSQPAQLALAQSNVPVARARLVDLDGRMGLVAEA